MWSDRRLQQIVYMEKMKLGFDNRWLLPPPLHQNLSSVGCSRAGVGRSSLCVRARVYSLSLLSLSSRSLTQEVFGVFSELCDEVDSRNGLRACARRSRE